MTASTQNHPVDTMGGRINRAREAAGYSTAQLARRLGVKTQTLSMWETDRSAPRSNRLTMLAGLLNVSPGWLLVGRGQAPVGSAASHEIRLLRHELDMVRADLVQVSGRLDQLLGHFDRLVEDGVVHEDETSA